MTKVKYIPNMIQTHAMVFSGVINQFGSRESTKKNLIKDPANLVMPLSRTKDRNTNLDFEFTLGEENPYIYLPCRFWYGGSRVRGLDSGASGSR